MSPWTLEALESPPVPKMMGRAQAAQLPGYPAAEVATSLHMVLC